MEPAYQAEFDSLKRRRSSSTSDTFDKCCKYSSLLPLLQGSDYSERSEKEFDKLVNLNIDVDYFDPEYDDCSPLCYAVQNRLHDWTKLLLECGAKPDNGSTTVSDIAWFLEDYDIVFKLISADGPYPKDFKTENFSVKQSCKIKARLWKTEKFHKKIKEKSFKEASELAEKLIQEGMKTAYDANNKSALSVALECESFEIYAFLRSKGFGCGIDSDHDALLKRIRGKAKKELDKIIEKYFESADFHILDLLSKSRLGMNNDKKNFKKLKIYFEELDKIVEIQPILKIAAGEKGLSLIFDFNREDIKNLDLVSCVDVSGVRGRTYKKTMKIFIAAKQGSESEVVGILAQEFTHFALLKVYDNNFLPYRSNDFKREAKYAEIVNVCRDQKKQEKIINDAFKYDDDKATAAELIARVPQLLAQNNVEKLTKNRETFKKLFEFFYQEVCKDIKLEADLIMPKQCVQDLNKTLGVFHHMKTFKMHCREIKIKRLEIEPGKNIFVPSKLPKLLLSNIISGFKLNDSENIFVELEQLTIRDNLHSIEDIVYENFCPTIYVTDSTNIDEEEVARILGKIEKANIVFISDRPFIDLQKKFKNHPEVRFIFSDLNNVSKKEVLNSVVDFQGEKVALKNIFGDDLEEIETWPLEDVLDAFSVQINNFERFFPKLSEISMPRSFKLSDNYEILEAEDIVTKLQREKTIVIADVAGMGKTTSAVNLAKLLKVANVLSWVSFFDLKQYSELFENQKSIRRPDFYLVLEQMVNLEREIEKKLFNFSFKNAKNIFVIDSFDEISPRYKNFVLNLMKHIQRFENRLLVTTRTHLEDDLVTELGRNQKSLAAVKVLPFSEKNQIEFLVKFWKQKQESVSAEDLEKKARRLIENFKVHLGREKVCLEIPLQLFMLADLTKSCSGFFNFDIKLVSLYERFIENKLEVYNKKGLLASSDNTTFQMKEFNVLQFHQMKAFETFFGKEVAASLGSSDVPYTLTKDEICRIGFLQIGFNGRYQFSHQDFGVFFVAQKLLKSVTTKANSDSVTISHDLLAKVLIGDSHYNESFRSLINEKLGGNDEIFHITEISQKLEECLKIEKNYGFLIRFIEKKQYNLITFVFKKLSLNNELKIKIMKYKNPSQYNALHVAMECFESWNVIWDCAESFANASELKDFFHLRGGIVNISLKKMLENAQWKDSDETAGALYIKGFLDPYRQKYEPIEVNLEPITPSLLAWNAIEENFEPEHQKAILFEQRGGNIFENLNFFSGGVQLGLNALRKLYNPEELHDRIFDSFRNKNIIYVSSQANKEIIINFLEELFHSDDEKRIFETFYKNDSIKHIEARNFSEHASFRKIIDTLERFGETQSSENAAESLFEGFRKCFGQILVQISASQNFDIFSYFWSFLCKINVIKEHRASILLFEYKASNSLISVMRNKNESVFKFMLNEIKEILEFSDFEKALCTWKLIENFNFQRERPRLLSLMQTLDLDIGVLYATQLLGTYSHYAALAKCEAFEMLWLLLQDKLSTKNLKTFVFQKLLCHSTLNPNKSTVKFIIDKARTLLTRNDFALASNSDVENDRNWLVESLGTFAKTPAPEILKMFWSLLQEKLSENDLKALILKRNREGRDFMMSSASSSNESTIELVIDLVGELLDREDFKATVNDAALFKSQTDPFIDFYGFEDYEIIKNENWLVDAFCRYASAAKPVAFGAFLTLLQRKLARKDQKVLIFAESSSSKPSANVMVAAIVNSDKSTVKLVFNFVGDLLDQNDFETAMESDRRNWLAKTLNCYACSSPEAFEIFWTFLQQKLKSDDLKKVFFIKTSFCKNVLMSASVSKFESTVVLVADLAKNLLDRNDFEKALSSDDANWLSESLLFLSAWARPKNFEIIWQFLKENLKKSEQKSIFLRKNKKEENALMISVTNKYKASVKIVINLAENLLGKDDFTAALQSRSQNWLDGSLRSFSLLAEPDSFRMFWAILQKNLDDVDLKSIFLKRNENGENALMASAKNKNTATVAIVINILSNIFDHDDFAKALNYESQNWVVDALCEYSSEAALGSFVFFWEFLQDNIDDLNDQKMLLLQKNHKNRNALQSLVKNKNVSTFKFLYNKASKLFDLVNCKLL